MKKTLCAVMLGWILAHAIPGHAEPNGTELLRLCTEAVKAVGTAVDPSTVNFAAAERCMGQIDGFAGAAAFYESRPGAPGAICFPTEGTTIRQSVDTVMTYLESHPGQLDESATVLIFGAFLSAYPCS